MASANILIVLVLVTTEVQTPSEYRNNAYPQEFIVLIALAKTHIEEISNYSVGDEKACYVCKLLVAGYLGPFGVGRCFGKAVSTAFCKLRHMVNTTKAAIGIERTTPTDGEVHFNKMALLLNKLSASEETEREV